MICSLYLVLLLYVLFVFELSGDHRDLHVLTHSFPTRRSSDLLGHPDDAHAVVDTAWPEAALRDFKAAPFAQDQIVRRNPDIVEFDFEVAMRRSEEHTSELQSLMRISYAVFCLKKKNHKIYKSIQTHSTHISTGHKEPLI